MTVQTARRMAWSLVGFTLASVASGLVFLALSADIPVGERWGFRGFPAIFAVTFSALGIITALRRPENPIGWLFVAGGVIGGLQVFVEEYSVYAMLGAPGRPLMGGETATAVANWIWVPFIGIVLNFTILLFPNGRLHSPRWRLVAWLSPIATLVLMVAIATLPGPIEIASSLENPTGIADARALAVTVANLGYVTLMMVLALSVTSLVLRLRRASPVEKQQLKWFAFAAVLCVMTLAANIFTSIPGAVITTPGLVNLAETSVIISIAFLGCATAIAILRYRLYDIDLVINRTLVYVPLTAILTGLYIAGTGFTRVIFTSLVGIRSDAATALTTLIVVAAFTPVKNSLQSMVDKRFKEPRDPARDLAKFEKEVRSVLQVFDSEQMCRRLLDEAVAALSADAGAIYLQRNGDRVLVSAKGSPPGEDIISLPLVGARGDTLGYLDLHRAGRPYTEPEMAALKKCASAVGRAVELAK